MVQIGIREDDNCPVGFYSFKSVDALGLCPKRVRYQSLDVTKRRGIEVLTKVCRPRNPVSNRRRCIGRPIFEDTKSQHRDIKKPP